MMKAGNQNSRFAHQLERYACLYTSHARNLARGGVSCVHACMLLTALNAYQLNLPHV